MKRIIETGQIMIEDYIEAQSSEEKEQIISEMLMWQASLQSVNSPELEEMKRKIAIIATV